MHTNVRLTNKRRIHTQSNYTNTKLKAWFRRLLRIRPGNGAGLLYTVHPGTHTGEFVVDRTANVLMPALTAYNVTAVSQVLKPRVALRGPSVPRTRQSTRTDGRTDGRTYDFIKTRSALSAGASLRARDVINRPVMHCARASPPEMSDRSSTAWSGVSIQTQRTQRINAISEITQGPANRNRTVLYPAELKFLRFKNLKKINSPNFSTFLRVVQLTMQIKFNFNNSARVCHSSAACHRHTPSSQAAVIGLSNSDVIALLA